MKKSTWLFVSAFLLILSIGFSSCYVGYYGPRHPYHHHYYHGGGGYRY